MIGIDVDQIRLFVHVIAAAVWVGGQLVLAGLVPTLRTISPTAPKTVAKQFEKIAWPAFIVLFVSGMWNLFEAPEVKADGWGMTFGIKFMFVIAAAAGTFLHTKATEPKKMGMFAGIAGLASIIALFMGIQLTLRS